MSKNEIISQAIAIIPALLFTWVIIYGIYWLLGVIKWPRSKRRETLLEYFGSIDIGQKGVFRFGSLALISLISLYLELLLIRWVSSELRIFAYFKSLVLIACYLGFGLGAYLTRRKIYLAYTLIPLLGITFLIQLPWEQLRKLIMSLSGFIGWFSDIHIFGRAYFSDNFLFGLASAGIALSIVIPIFGLLAITFIPMGQFVGWYLENSKNGILAYSINIFASIVGIWLFTILSFLSTPPVVWFIVLGMLLLIFFWSYPRARIASLLTIAVLIALFFIGNRKTLWLGEQSWKGSSESIQQLETGKVQTYWSPYQKLTIIPLIKNGEIVRYVLNTNDSWYQQIINLSQKAINENPELYDDIPIQYQQYNLPYQFYKNPPSVLIAGAGMGNDAASALRNGAGKVTAVEIDPLIYKLGSQLHFEQPYSSDKVELHVDDARSFIQNSKEQYDLVVFSILDSHTTNSYYTNIRLDNYVYTLEAMQATKKLLKPDGIFVLSFNSERPWFATHLHDVVVKTFGKPPIMIQSEAGTFFIIDPGNRVDKVLDVDPQLKQYVRDHSDIPMETADLITDDWPYLYQQTRGIPLIIWLLSIGLVVITWLAFRRFNQSAKGIQWHFFFLGAAFILLEVQVISKIALLFGTTWLVNTFVITAMLVLILFSNWFVSKFPSLPRMYAFIGLFITMTLSYFIPTHNLFFSSVVVRMLVVTLLYCSPVFFAGIIFITSFKQIGFRAEAFGSNLLGSLVGGLLESLSFLMGIQSLVLVAGLLYLLAMLTMRSISSDNIEPINRELGKST